MAECLQSRIMGVPLPWLLLVALALPIHVSSAAAGVQALGGRCLIGDRSELRLFMNVSSGSLCCAVAQVYLARRAGGYCPQVNASLRLPFGVQCAVDRSLNMPVLRAGSSAQSSAYVPVASTQRAAEHLLCDLPGCADAVLAVAGEAQASAIRGEAAMLLPSPSCRAVKKSSAQEESLVPPLERYLIVAVLAVVTFVGLAVFHCVLAPRWVRRYSDAVGATAATLSSPVGGLVTEAHQIAINFEDLEQEVAGPVSPQQLPSPQSAPTIVSSHVAIARPALLVGRRPPTPLDLPGLDAEVPPRSDATLPPVIVAPPLSLQPQAQALGAPSILVSIDLEADAQSRLMQARARCRGHVVLLCAAGIIASLVRVVLLAAIMSPVGPGMAFIILLCVLQLGSLARSSMVPLPPAKHDNLEEVGFVGANPRLQDLAAEAAGASDAKSVRPCGHTPGFVRACGEMLGDLRVYAVSTLVCEVFVLALFAGGAFTGTKGSDVLQQLGGSTLVSSASIHFLVSQAALSLVLVRLYTAWLAHGLHKLRDELTYVVLPESPKARLSEAKRAALERRRRSQDVMVPAWEPPMEASVGSSVGSSAGSPLAASSPRKCHPWLQGGRARALFCAFSAVALVVTVASLRLWREHEQQIRQESSTCTTARRGMDFCVEKTYLGLFDEVSNFEVCCHHCDMMADCQAWSYQANAGKDAEGGRCWYMRFDKAPCSASPHHESCRCNTGPERMGGYRPEGGMVYTPGL